MKARIFLVLFSVVAALQAHAADQGEVAFVHAWALGAADSQVKPDSWRAMEGSGLSYGFSRDPVWIRSTINIPVTDRFWTGQRMYDLGSENLRNVEFRHYRDGQLVASYAAGSALPLSTRPIKARDLAFPVSLAPGENAIFVRIASNNGIAVQPSVQTNMDWHRNVSAQNALLGVFVGMTMILALYNFFVFGISRDRVFLSLGATLAAALLWHVSAAGVGSVYVYPEAPEVHGPLARIAAAFYCAGMCLLTNDYLQCRQWAPRVSLLLLGQAGAIIAVMVFPIFGVLPLLGQLIVFSAPVSCIAVGVVAARRRVAHSPSYTLSLTMFGLGLLAYVAQMSGLLPLHWALNVITELTVIGLGVVTSFGLASRITQEKMAKEIAQRDAEAKEKFLANMTHEIRTPLNAVIGFGELLHDKRLDEDARELVTKISVAGKNLLGIVNDILDLSKINAGKVELDPHPGSLVNVLQELRTIFEPQAHSKGLSLEVSCRQGVPSNLVFDQLRLTQVLTNLLGNAIKFTQAGGIRLTVDGKLVDGLVTLDIEVHDTGIGMTDVQAQRLFQPFTQADTSTTRQFGGSGLGLTISKEFVEMMGGQISLQSQAGVGSTFKVLIPDLPMHQEPLQESPHETQVAAASDEFDISDTTILVVDDNETNQILVSRMLAKAGVHSVVASNGEEALRQLQDNAFHAVLMDCQMPVMDGYEATRKLRENPSHANLPVIALTANASEQDRRDCLQAGMTDYLTKPIRYGALVSCLSKRLSQDSGVLTAAQATR